MILLVLISGTNVAKIVYRAEGCNSLTTALFPASLEEIGDEAFKDQALLVLIHWYECRKNRLWCFQQVH